MGDVKVINIHRPSIGPATLRARSSGTGMRMTMSVTSEPMSANFDEGLIAKRAAQVLAKTIREQTQGITRTVKAATAKARRSIELAFFRGESYAVKRFSGGRTGVTPPKVGETRQFNHSGRLAGSIVANYSKKTKEWIINFAANRWDLRNFRSLADMQEAFAKWVALVPVLQDASSDLGIQRALRETGNDILRVHKMGASHTAALRSSKMTGDALRAAGDVLNAGGDSDEEEAA